MTNPTQRRGRSRRPRSTGRRHIKNHTTRRNSKSSKSLKSSKSSKSSNRSSNRRASILNSRSGLSNNQINTLLEDVFDQNILSKIRKDLKELQYDPDFEYEIASVPPGYKGSLYEQAIELMSQYAKGFGPFSKYDYE